jgi:RHS repeat-associated protein
MAMSVVYSNFGGEIVHENRGGVERFYVPDTLGSTQALVDASGAVTDTFEYWSYGEERSHTGSSATPFTWLGVLGYFKDVLNKLYYVRARYMRPELARWQTVDPLWPRRSAYSYAFGQPSSQIDPSGMDPRRRVVVPPRPGGIFGGLDYGAFCGPSNKRNPADRVLPQDCVDACCLVHDRCLEAQYGAGVSELNAHSCCDSALAHCADQARESGCCKYSPVPWACAYAGDTISIVFGLIGPLNPAITNCVPVSEYYKYSRIHWGGPGKCRQLSVPTSYGPVPYKPDPSGPPEGDGGGGRPVGRSGGAQVWN